MLAAQPSVTCRLVDGREYTGVVHTVDPETGNLILLRPTVCALR